MFGFTLLLFHLRSAQYVQYSSTHIILGGLKSIALIVPYVVAQVPFENSREGNIMQARVCFCRCRLLIVVMEHNERMN